MPPTLTFADLEARLKTLGMSQLVFVSPHEPDEATRAFLAKGAENIGVDVWYLGCGTLRFTCRCCGTWLMDLTVQQMAFPPFHNLATLPSCLHPVDEVASPHPSLLLPQKETDSAI